MIKCKRPFWFLDLIRRLFLWRWKKESNVNECAVHCKPQRKNWLPAWNYYSETITVLKSVILIHHYFQSAWANAFRMLFLLCFLLSSRLQFILNALAPNLETILPKSNTANAAIDCMSHTNRYVKMLIFNRLHFLIQMVIQIMLFFHVKKNETNKMHLCNAKRERLPLVWMHKICHFL